MSSSLNPNSKSLTLYYVDDDETTPATELRLILDI
jgi:hypothetical protein